MRLNAAVFAYSVCIAFVLMRFVVSLVSSAYLCCEMLNCLPDSLTTRLPERVVVCACRCSVCIKCACCVYGGEVCGATCAGRVLK